jgi:hypothetical protein
VLEPTDYPVSFDLTWEGAHAAFEEPRHYHRQMGRVIFDTMRFAQTGRWSGILTVGGSTMEVSPRAWWGSRDRSWGVRPVGEPEPPGIRANNPSNFFWIYTPVQFDGWSLLAIVQEESDGTRVMEEGVRIWPEETGRRPEWLGRPEHELHFVPGSRRVERATLRFARGTTVDIEPLIPLAVAIGTGYGLDADWRHGMYQGPLVVQGLDYSVEDPTVQLGFIAITDCAARFTCAGETGYGLFEYAVIGPHEGYKFESWSDMAP